MRKTQLFAIAVMIFLASSSYAASFDCTKAAASIEKLICSDETLSKLDADLGDVYKVAMEKAQNKEALKQHQRIWLKEKRNKCGELGCLIQVYQERIGILAASVSHAMSSPLAVEDKFQSSSDIKNPKFKISKGRQYEVCRVFNDYLNSSYYKKGDCVINDYPVDRRLRSPKYTPVDILKYKSQWIDAATARYKSAEKIEMQKRYSQGFLLNWYAAGTINEDVDNDGSKEFLFIYRAYSLNREKSCEGLGHGNTWLLNGDQFDNKWRGALSGEPIIFDGRTFIVKSWGGDNISISEPESVQLNKYRSGQSYSGEITMVYPCELKSAL